MIQVRFILACFLLATAARAQGPGAPLPTSVPRVPGVTGPVQEIAAGDVRLEMGRPVRLRLHLQDAPPLWECARTLVHGLAPASPFEPATSPAAPLGVFVSWSDPVSGQRTVAVSSSVAELSVAAGPERTASYYIVWRAHDNGFEMRVPASPATFKAQIVRPQPAIVVEATGSAEGILLGDRIPVRVKVAELDGIRTIGLFYRATPPGSSAVPPGSYTSSPMECSETGPPSLWTGSIPMPPDPGATVDYYIEIVDSAGRNSFYGSADLPHRIRLRDPGDESAR
ncbi:MAG: hypothetical protein HY816_06475 [Candidatus Wallbacteria bacterium]|nr:hypothetical protein [Candidatus Wallbacteria bacterium]